MFNISTDIICKIIVRAREINIENDLSGGDAFAPETEEEQKENLAEERVDFTRTEVKDVINDLEPDQQKELIAIMMVGRGDYDADQWSDALKEASNIPKHGRADYLLSKTMLADYLQEGLGKFGFSCDE